MPAPFLNRKDIAMLYKVIGCDYESNDIDEIINYCLDEDYHDERDDDFSEWVDERYDYIDIGDTRYYASEIIDKFGCPGDVVHYYQEYMYELDEDEARDNLRAADVGEEVYIQAYTVRCYEDEPEEDDDEYVEPVCSEDLIERERAKIEARKNEDELNDLIDIQNKDAYFDLFQVIHSD